MANGFPARISYGRPALSIPNLFILWREWKGRPLGLLASFIFVFQNKSNGEDDDEDEAMS